MKCEKKPEIDPDSFHCKYFPLNLFKLFIANEISSKVTHAKDSNIFNVNAKTKGLDENPLFIECVDNLHKTYSFPKRFQKGRKTCEK